MHGELIPVFGSGAGELTELSDMSLFRVHDLMAAGGSGRGVTP